MAKRSNIELIMISITGADQPGVTAALSEIIASHDAQILDIGQADIHHNLSLGMLIKTESCRSGDILKDLLFKGARRDGGTITQGVRGVLGARQSRRP